MGFGISCRASNTLVFGLTEHTRRLLKMHGLRNTGQPQFLWSVPLACLFFCPASITFQSVPSRPGGTTSTTDLLLTFSGLSLDNFVLCTASFFHFPYSHRSAHAVNSCPSSGVVDPFSLVRRARVLVFSVVLVPIRVPLSLSLVERTPFTFHVFVIQYHADALQYVVNRVQAGLCSRRCCTVIGSLGSQFVGVCRCWLLTPFRSEQGSVAVHLRLRFVFCSIIERTQTRASQNTEHGTRTFGSLASLGSSISCSQVLTSLLGQALVVLCSWCCHALVSAAWSLASDNWCFETGKKRASPPAAAALSRCTHFWACGIWSFCPTQHAPLLAKAVTTERPASQ